MKAITKAVTRDQRGIAALTLVLVLLVIGALILTPLLGLMGTGLVSGQIYEKKTNDYYAADAGVTDAIWRIQTNNLTFVGNHSGPWQVGVNNRSVTVEAYRQASGVICARNFTYQILSTSTNDDGSGTTIDAHLSVSYLDLANLLNNAIISENYISIKNGVYVTGNVTSGGTVNNKGTINGTVKENATLTWPTAADLSTYYLDDVKTQSPYTSDTIDIAGGDTTIGPLYRDGALTIKNSGDTSATLTLNGTLYITGDTKICYNTPNNNQMVLDLNGHTIFVASNSTGSGKEALQLGDQCTIVGSGCIIAVGDVYFNPKGNVGSPDDFVLVMSVRGTTTLQPSGTFYGCLAGDLAVYSQSGQNATIIYTAPAGKGLDIPWGAGNYTKLPPVTGLRIDSWQIS